MMKKILVVLILCFLALILASCSVPYNFSQDISDLDQIQIEIVNLETETGDSSDAAYNEEKISIIKTIENDKKEDFISDFKKVKSYQPNSGSRIDYVYGKAIRITYSNGDIELITHYGTATVKNGEISNQTITFDSDAFSKLLDKYS